MLYDFLMKLPLRAWNRSLGTQTYRPQNSSPYDKKTLTFEAIFRYMGRTVYGEKPVFYGGNFLPEREPSARVPQGLGACPEESLERPGGGE